MQRIAFHGGGEHSGGIEGSRRSGSISTSRRASRVGSTAGSNGGGGGSGTEGSQFHIMVNAKSELHLQLVYRPHEVKAHATDVSVQTMTIGSGQPAPLRRVITAEGLQPRIIISKTVVDFGTRVVIRSNQVRP